VGMTAWAVARNRAWGWTTRAVVVGAALGMMTVTTAAEAQEGKDDKLDKRLREQLARNGDLDSKPVKVIVTTRPGGRGNRLRKLAAHGARVSDDFTVIDASAARLPLNAVRHLAADRDVLAVSVDAEVMGDGIATAVTGTALQNGYSLRGTLGLRGTFSTSMTRRFQQGNSAGYTGTVDTDVQASSPNRSNGTSTRIEVDNAADGSGGFQWTLILFDNLFGSGASQIPVGSTITSATLTVNHYADGDAAATASLHRMLVDWSGSSTWNSMPVSSAGIQIDDVEARSTPDASVSNLATTGAKAFSGPDLTAAVQAWANGQPNRGWTIRQTHDNGWILRSSEDATVSNRPQLTVTYKAPVNTTSLTGAGVTVAVVDSGLFEDGGGSSRIKTTRDFTTGALDPPHVAPIDAYGHGTHIAGLIGGNKTEVEGVAPEVTFVSLRVLDEQGHGSTSHVINAIQWAVQHKAAYGIDVLNLSLGHPIYESAATDPLVQAVEAATRAGISIVVSAGNVGRHPTTGQVGYAGITSPGNAPSAITVGAARTMGTTRRTDDLVSDFSSRGPTWYDAFAKPDIVAPGQHILSAAATSQTLYARHEHARGPSYGGRSYLYLSGTSMATGVVSGTVAIMIEHARLTYGVRPSHNTIKAMLQFSALPLSSPGGARYDALTQGAGALNALGAAVVASGIDPRVDAGSYWATGWVPTTSDIDGETISFGENIVWGDNVLWGASLFTHLTAWNDNIVWGDDDNILWGDTLASQSSDDNIVWGDNSLWGDNIVWGDSYDVLGAVGDNIVWGDLDDNIVLGDSDNIVWGDAGSLNAP
jgi:serine protease AprX